MSIFSDHAVGALSDVEFHNACVEMNARDRWEREQEYYEMMNEEDEEEEQDDDREGEEDQIRDSR